MLTENQLHPYQRKAVDHAMTHEQCAFWLFLGAGKTVSALTAIVNRQDRLEVQRVLIIAPLRVAQAVWMQEAAKWAHTQHLTFSLIHGNAPARERALNMQVDVYIINYEGVAWLARLLHDKYISQEKNPPFNMVIFDEVSKLKNAKSQRHKALREFVNYFPYRIGLTATPASNGLKDVFGQYLALDSGSRLGVSEYQFKQEFFDSTGYGGYGLSLKVGADERIKEAIADITLQMDVNDYLTLPPVTFNDIIIKLPAKVQQQYEKMEKEFFCLLDDGEQIEISNAAALSTKCLQMASGAMYTEPGSPQWSHVHDAKLDALEDIVEEAGHNPILLMYQFIHDRERIMKKFPQAEFIKSGMSNKKVADIIERWNRGEIEILIGHAASMGHGLNLQDAPDSMIVWFGLPWSLELYAQANGRIAERQGVKHHVVINRLLMDNTLDMAVELALSEKAVTEADLRKAVGDYRKQKLGVDI